MKLLMIGHLLGDFYFQTANMADKKKASLGYTIEHCLVYSVVMYVILAIMTGNLVSHLLPVLLIGGLHLFIDGMKSVLNKYIKDGKCEIGVFLIDQLIHIVILFVVSRFFVIEFNISWLPGLSEGLLSSIFNSLTFSIAFLLCGRPAAIFVSMVFALIPETIEAANTIEKRGSESRKQENVKVGAWIGILEREIILILGILGEYGAIGFIVTAKSLARHSQFDENPAFAEKYLIGTLVSSLIALLSVMMCSVW